MTVGASFMAAVQWTLGWSEPAPHAAYGAVSPLDPQPTAGGVPSLRRYVMLWVLLGCITVLIAAIPAAPIAIYEPHLSSAVGAISGVVGLALLQMGLLRFRLLKRRLDLHVGLAFGTLALGNLFAVWACGATDAGILPLDVSIYALLLIRAVGTALFLSALRVSHTGSPGSGSIRPLAWTVMLGAIGSIGVILLFARQLPPLLAPEAVALLDSTRPVTDFLSGQSPLLVGANIAMAVALAVAAIGHTFVARTMLEPYLGALAAALTLLVFAQVQTVFMPAMANDYLATGDAFRVAAYILLLSNLVWRTVADIADRTANNERLRLSRELHDGLAQELALLRLRLSRAGQAGRSTDQLVRDLQVAQRVAETASLEARQAIVALRSERITWQELDAAFAAFGDEFAENHAVAVATTVSASDPTACVDTLVESELLRILNEALSNAVRHGSASHVHVDLSESAGSVRMTIRDDGRGFDSASTSRGYGLRSMSERAERFGGAVRLDSAPGRGTTIAVDLPLDRVAARSDTSTRDVESTSLR